MWGETVDLVNGREDEGEGDLAAKRPDGLCSTHPPARPDTDASPPRPTIAKDCVTGGASFGTAADRHRHHRLTSSSPPTPPRPAAGTTTDGCSPFTNAGRRRQGRPTSTAACAPSRRRPPGRDRRGRSGTHHRQPQRRPRSACPASTRPWSPRPRSVSSDRETIRTAIGGGSDRQRHHQGHHDGDRSTPTAGCIGEKSSAFGGAIRDMWNPTCYGDPGKVSDAEYKCAHRRRRRRAQQLRCAQPRLRARSSTAAPTTARP